MEKNSLGIDLNSTYSAKQESQEAQLGYHHRMYSNLILNSIRKVKKCCMIIMIRFSVSDTASKAV